jgi:hypothetical protein
VEAVSLDAICRIVLTGDWNFQLKATAYKNPFDVSISLTATGGCGNAKSPGLVQVRRTRSCLTSSQVGQLHH